MNYQKQLWMVLLALVSASLTCPTPTGAEIMMSTGVRYDAFRDNQSPRADGHELTFSVGLAYKQQRYTLSLETAYSQANVAPDSQADVSLSGVTDLLLAAAYTHSLTSRPLSLFTALNVNLPTGQERLSDAEQEAEAGESNDLFEVDNFGDGLNVGVTLGAAGDVGAISLGAQAAYVYNGAYDPTRDREHDDLDPGDQLMAIGLFGWQMSPRIALDVSLTYAHFLTDRTDGQKSLHLGDKFVVSSNLRYDRQPVGVVLSLQSTVQAKNTEYKNGVSFREAENSNGQDYFGFVNITYTPTAALTLRLLADVRYYGASDRRVDSGLPLDGKRVRYAVGPGFQYVVNKHLTCDGLLKLHRMRQEADSEVDHAITFQGLNLDVGLTYTF